MHLHEDEPETPEPNPHLGMAFAMWGLGVILLIVGGAILVNRPDLLGPAVLVGALGALVFILGNRIRRGK